MLSASRKDMIGATMYLAGDEINSSDPSNSYPCWIQLVKCEPCPICARMILNAGISEVVTLYDTYTRDDIAKRLI